MKAARKCVAARLSLEAQDFGSSSFLVAPEPGEGGDQRGGLGRAHQLFGEKLPKLLEELNETLAA